jgi:hypothetical protein
MTRECMHASKTRRRLTATSQNVLVATRPLLDQNGLDVAALVNSKFRQLTPLGRSNSSDVRVQLIRCHRLGECCEVPGRTRGRAPA